MSNEVGNVKSDFSSFLHSPSTPLRERSSTLCGEYAASIAVLLFAHQLELIDPCYFIAVVPTTKHDFGHCGP